MTSTLPIHTRADIIAAAKVYVGVRYLDEGRSKVGVDCVGLLCAVATDLHLPFTDKKGYGRVSHDRTFMAHLLKNAVLRRGCIATPGVIAVIRQNLHAGHVGIFSTLPDVGLTIIHAHVARQQVVEERWVPGPDLRLMMVLDFPGVSPPLSSVVEG